MSSTLGDGDGQQSPVAEEVPLKSSEEMEATNGDSNVITVTLGATVPTGFEHTAAEEVKEKIGIDARISKDRGRIYFQITTDKLFQVHHLRSVDNLFVVVEEYDSYQFKESKEETLMDLQDLACKLPWTNALEVWRLNNSLKKKRGRRRGPNFTKRKPKGRVNKDTVEAVTADTEAVTADTEAVTADTVEAVTADTVEAVTADTEAVTADTEAVTADTEAVTADTVEAVTADTERLELEPELPAEGQAEEEEEGTPDTESQDSEETAPEAKLIKFRVTCNRAGDKHSFSSNEAARDFGGAVQEFFQWKADMTKFDIEILLNIHKDNVVIGIALTEESLHRRNISHFGPTTLRSTLCYGMLRLCKPQASDVILDPMCGTGAIPLEGAIEFQDSFYIAGDNNDMAVSRTVNNICHIQKRRHDKGSAPGLPIDTVQWDLCRLPMRTSSVDIIITDMPFGKRIGSWKKNWDLYPSCLREMARVVRPGSGKAVLLTQDKKCFSKAVSRMGGLWKKSHTVWVNVGGLHAAVYLLKRTVAVFGQTPEDVYEPQGTGKPAGEEEENN